MKSSACSYVKCILQALIYAAVTILAIEMLAHRAEAKVVRYGSGVEQVRIKYGGPTVFRFQKAVQTITGASRLTIKPANAADPSYKVLAVEPRFTNGVNDVSFFLVDGTLVRAKILVSPSDPATDSFYDFISADAVDSGANGEGAPPLTEIELLRAMVRDGDVAGYKVIRLTGREKEKKAGVEIELIRIYRGSPFNGYVYQLKNVSGKSVEVDVRHVTVGNPSQAILSQADLPVLAAKGKGASETLLRIVAKSTSSSRDVILALEPEEKKSKGDQ